MRRTLSCLTPVFALFCLLSDPSEATAGGAGLGFHGGRVAGGFAAHRFTPALGRSFHADRTVRQSFIHRSFWDRHGARRHSYGFYGDAFGGGWPVVEADGPVAAPIRREEDAVPTVIGIRPPPAAAPVVYVLNAPAGRLSGIGPHARGAGPGARIVQVSVPRWP